MDTILDEIKGVTPENLFTICGMNIIRLSSRTQAVTMNQNGNSAEIYFEKKLVGWITGIPLNPLSSRISIVAIYQDCDINRTIMNTFKNYLMDILNEKKPDKPASELDRCGFIEITEDDYDRPETKKFSQPQIDPTDERIIEICKKDLLITDGRVGFQIGMSRQAANTRRRKLRAIGYRV